MRSEFNRSRRWQHRIDVSDREGMSRAERRDAARSTRLPTSPRGRPPLGQLLKMAHFHNRQERARTRAGKWINP